MTLRRRDGWLIEAATPVDLPISTRTRFQAYGKPLAARAYDLDVRLTSRLLYGAAIERQAEFIVEALAEAAHTGLPLLDVPGGSGLVLARALRGRRQQPDLVLADLSVPMLRRARARIGDRALYVLADVASLPFAPGAFGAVHSGNGLHVFPDTGAAVGQIARVTNAIGSVFATTWVARGRTLPELWMRTLASRGVCNAPRPSTFFEEAFASAGLEPSSAAIAGSVLLWRGHPSRAAR